MGVFFREYGSAMLSAICAILVIVLIAVFIGNGFSDEDITNGNGNSHSVLNAHKMVLNKNKYNTEDINNLKLKLSREYFTIKRNSDKFSTTSKIVNYLTSNNYLVCSGDIDTWESSSFNSKRLGIFEIKLKASNDKEESTIKLYVKVVEE